MNSNSYYKYYKSPEVPYSKYQCSPIISIEKYHFFNRKQGSIEKEIRENQIDKKIEVNSGSSEVETFRNRSTPKFKIEDQEMTSEGVIKPALKLKSTNFGIFMDNMNNFQEGIKYQTYPNIITSLKRVQSNSTSSSFQPVLPSFVEKENFSGQTKSSEEFTFLKKKI